MARNPLPWRKHRYREWLSSELRASMNLAERGLYSDLLDRHFAEGSVPSDEATLVRLTGVPLAEFSRAWKRVRQEFKPDPNRPGRLVQAEAVAEMDAMDRYAAQQAVNGRLGGRSKKATGKRPLSEAKANENPECTQGEKRIDKDKIPPPTPPDGERQEPPNGFNNQAAFDQFSKAYPKDKDLYGPLFTDAWHDIVETAVNPAVIFSEVMAGLERMTASGKEERYLPPAPKFLRERNYLQAWRPEKTRTGVSDRVKRIAASLGD